MIVPQPENETARVAALRAYDLLGTAADHTIDDLTLLAAQICQTPIAVVSLVDEKRQWFKSKVGLALTGTARDAAFCAHAILQPDKLMEVRDARLDPRFAANPLVTGEPNLRFYAGAPLVAANGVALGALCVADRVPRELSDGQRAALCALSRHVVSHFDLNRALAANTEPLRKKWPLENTSFVALLVAAVALLAGGIFSIRSLLWLGENAGQLAHHNRVIAQAEQISIDAGDVQNGQRGYLITGEPRFLDSYRATVAKVMPHLQELRQLTIENPRHQRRIDALEDLTADRLNVTQSQIALRQTEGFEAVRDASVEGREKTGAGRTRKLVQEIVDEERELIRQHDWQAGTSARLTLAAIGALGALAVGLLGVIVWRSRRERLARRESQTKISQLCADLASLNSSLEQKVAARTGELKRTETLLRQQCDKLVVSEAETLRLLAVAEASRRAVLDVLADEKRASRNLRESEERFRELAENIHEVFWITNPEKNRILYISPAYEKIWGRTCASLEVNPRAWLDAIHPDDLERIQQASAVKQVTGDYNETYRILRPDGTLRWIHDRAFPIRDESGTVRRIVGTAEDITARRDLEQQFRQVQKMEAIGTLAGGIAHDFNNILTAIGGYTELARLQVEGDETTTRFLTAVMQASSRAAALVRQILTFSRQQEQSTRLPLDLAEAVIEPLTLLRATIPTTIEFDFHLPDDLPAVLADATQIHQIVMNLCTNAAHAMKDRTGRLGVRLEEFDVDEELAKIKLRLQPGPYVRLAITDTGHGMDQATVERIFEPFFTTKKPGDGTGLGLAVVHGIMQSYDGAATVYSQPGDGTTFHLYFPVHHAKVDDAGPPPAPVPRGHGERILVLDDEVVLAQLGVMMLQTLGYAAQAATDPHSALASFRLDPEAFDLVFTDLTMPGMTGMDFARQLLDIRPDLPVVLATGYVTASLAERARAVGICEVLVKPHTKQSLGEAVHRALGSAATVQLSVAACESESLAEATAA